MSGAYVFVSLLVATPELLGRTRGSGAACSSRTSPKGQVVIPKPIRDELGIEPGDEVVFETDGKDVRVRRREDDVEARRARINALMGILSDGASTDDLLEERRRGTSSRSARRRGGALVVLDSWALLAVLKRETAAERVRTTWEAEGVSMSSINLGEALYVETRRVGASRSAEVIRAARVQMTVVDPDWDLVSAAASLKARGGLSYADAFCVATAQRLDAPVLTGDPEIVALSGEVEVVDLRSA